MYDLPLFPLNTVLFPVMPRHLYIFEPRYRTLLRRCLEDQRPFGVVLIARGMEAGGPLPSLSPSAPRPAWQMQTAGRRALPLSVISHQ